MKVPGTAAWFESQLNGIVETELLGLADSALEPLVRRETADALAMAAPIVRLGVVSSLAIPAVAGAFGTQTTKSRNRRALIWGKLPGVPPFEQSRQAVRGLCLVAVAGLMGSRDL